MEDIDVEPFTPLMSSSPFNLQRAAHRLSFDRCVCLFARVLDNDEFYLSVTLFIVCF